MTFRLSVLYRDSDTIHTMIYHITPKTPTAPELMNRLSWLDTGLCLLKFEKADGTVRTMLGTRCPREIVGLATTGLQPMDKHGRLVVWDCEAQSYRSFIAHRLIDLVRVV